MQCYSHAREGVKFPPHFQDRDLSGTEYLGILMGWATLAPIMWARLMVVLVPLVPKLGSLLEVIKVWGDKPLMVCMYGEHQCMYG